MSDPSTPPATLSGPKAIIRETANPAEVGTCKDCGQELIRTATDCWHPWNVPVACPPEPPSSDWPAWQAWYAAGNRTGRPGRDAFVPLATGGSEG